MLIGSWKNTLGFESWINFDQVEQIVDYKTYIQVHFISGAVIDLDTNIDDFLGKLETVQS